ncbi:MULTISPECIES: YqgE/AlgH family protein [Marinicauda]|uniref:YqgE/AlgH family protein n=1 Tax=Marinicauda TaxID=1649466 RepID=UPI0022E8E272|nr:YqgE/AlgH family protein [Marinicauda sp. Alg238-R41]
MTEDTHHKPDYLTGRLLIASPAIGDPRFDRSVVLVCAHSNDSAMGLVVNKPMDALRLPTLFEQLGVTSEIEAPDQAVLFGGPIDRDRGFVLHTDDYASDETTLGIGPGVGLTATKDILEAIASSTPPRRCLLALGYAGWTEGQLEDEIGSNAWLVVDPDEDLLFDEDFDRKWEKALGKLGIAPEFLSASSGHA